MRDKDMVYTGKCHARTSQLDLGALAAIHHEQLAADLDNLR